MTRKTDGDLRMLGVADGYSHVLTCLRLQIIGPIDGQYSPRIHSKHTRKLATKAAKLAPLRTLERWLVDRHRETLDAYQKTRQPLPDPEDDYADRAAWKAAQING